MDRRTEMEAFVAVVEETGFSAAARRLRVTPSAVSKQVTRLEARLGVALLRRNTRGVQASAAGEVYYRRAQEILNDTLRLERDISHYSEAPAGVVRVSLSSLIARHAVLAMASDFLTRYPEVRLTFELSDDYVDLLQDRFDIAVRVGELEDASFITRRIGRLTRTVVAAPSYIERRGTPHHPEELCDHNCLTLNVNNGSMNHWRFTGPEGPLNIEVSGNFEANTIHGLSDAAQAGVGIARMATVVAHDAITSGHLVPLLLPYMTPDSAPLQVVYPSTRHPSLAAKLFADALVESIGAVMQRSRQT
ncbi:MAG: LysR family transcriptional regulator [Nannocystaceae bacterium]|nr:LysR family transcriptional regulator [Nannocystaceae bacterium]